jgi:Esterase-like activity of phytase
LLSFFTKQSIRRFAVLILGLGLLAGVWWRSEGPPPSREAKLALLPYPALPGCCETGPLKLIGAWQLKSPHEDFGGYSALVRVAPGRLLALSDRGFTLEFSEPGALALQPRFGAIVADTKALKANRDVEAATLDPDKGLMWIAQESRNAIERHRLGSGREAFREISEMRDWSRNAGPEAMVRLRDGRFVVLCECNTGWFASGKHPALLFGSDPAAGGAAQAFTFAGIEGYRPTDMAAMPDGRVLILARRLTWPVPARFAIKVLIADPAEITAGGVWQAHEIADLQDPWPIDNYEGLAIERMPGGKLIAWIISDENEAVSQRVLLLKVEIDESKL